MYNLHLLYLCCKMHQQKEKFFWGVATCAYQVEGAYQADGKGESKWDFLTNKVQITKLVIGEKQRVMCQSICMTERNT